MNEYAVNQADIVSVADAIREKTGGSEMLEFPSGFVDAIDEISGDSGSTDVLKQIAEGTFTELNLAEYIEVIVPYAFYGNYGLNKAKFGTVGRVDMYAFGSCTSLRVLDFEMLSRIEYPAFSGCSSLKALILRCNTRVCEYGGMSDLFSACKEIEIYVPRALVDSYKVALNWEAHSSQIKPLEDYTVDGTITGEFDESKIV